MQGNVARAWQCGTCMATWHVHGNVHHSSGDVIDLVVGDETGERLGVSPPSAIPDSGERTAESRIAESHISDSKSAPCDSLNTENRTLKTVGEADTIGTTSNHPFWSEDRQEFVQASSLEIGERLQTLSGDVKVVQQKLPRPGPQPVFNLEVHAEHVYCVGQDGVLVHNSCDDLDELADLAADFEDLKRTGLPDDLLEVGLASPGKKLFLYQKVGPKINGIEKHLKFGVAQDLRTRYSQVELGGGRLKQLAFGDATEILALERNLHRSLPLGLEEGQKAHGRIQAANGLRPPPYP